MDDPKLAEMHTAPSMGTRTTEAVDANLVSVIVPASNLTREGIELTLESIYWQTYRNIEIIILGSVSASINLKAAAAQYGSFQPQKPTWIVSGSLSDGIKRSRGNFLVLLPAGDRLLPEAVEAGVSALRTNMECAFAFGLARPVGIIKVEIAESQRSRLVGSDFYTELLRGDYIGRASAVMYRRSPLVDSGLATMIRPNGSADANAYCLNMELAKDNNVHFHGKLVVDYDASGTLADEDIVNAAKDSLITLRSQCPVATSHLRTRDAYREGLQAITNRLFLAKSGSIRSHLKGRHWWMAACSALDLLGLIGMCFWEHPRGAIGLLSGEIIPWISRRSLALALTSHTDSAPPVAGIGYSAQQRVRQIVRSTIPPHASVAVAAQYDTEIAMLDFGHSHVLSLGRTGAKGSGTTVTDDNQSSVRCLHQLRGQGAEYLLIPSSSYWWLDRFHGELKKHLDTSCRTVWDDRHCRIYALADETTPVSTRAKVLVAGYFSFERGHATAGDLQVRDLVCDWLLSAGYHYDIAHATPFLGGVDWKQANPSLYSHVIFACGPFQKRPGLVEFLNRFQACQLIGINLSMLESLDLWNPFDILLERDSTRTARPDLAFSAKTDRVPVVGLCLKEHSGETRTAHACIRRLVAAREMAAVRVDTRLDQSFGGMNSTGLRSPGEVESLLARMDVVVTTRLHGMVLSLKNGVPVVAIDPGDEKFKVEKQAKLIGWPMVFRSSEINDSKLEEAFEWCMTEEARALALECASRAKKEARTVSQALLDGLRKSAQ